ncbi:hypothetical protein [Nocardia sp. NBC_01327]|uniref:hypothetical protein n=1 Tax=Nocardia sp. NBC_01327 TaxID=2903593 RepID=UPI002E136F4C|nr:hypothetical protein OG326_24090 [Nocardia sp. NBC_01327]
MSDPREQLTAIIREHRDEAPEAILAVGWQPPARRIETYSRRPIVVEAMQLTGDTTMALIDWLPTGRYLIDDQAGMPALWVKSLDGGRHRVYLGWWVVQEHNDLRAYSPSAFETAFEPAAPPGAHA